MRIRTRIKIAIALSGLRNKAKPVYDCLIFAFVIYRFLKSWLKNGNMVLDDNQHYLPRFLQKKFEINDTNKKGWAYIYKRGLPSPKDKAIKSIGQETNYYISRNRFTKKWENTYDDIYKFLEDSTSPIIAKLSENKDVSPSIDEENLLAEFVAALYTRTPGFRMQVKHLVLYLMESRGMGMDSLGNRKIMENIFIHDTLKIDWDDVQNYIPSKVTDLQNAQNHLMVISSFVSQKINKQIFDKTLNVLETKNRFILADTPVVVIDFLSPLQWPSLWELSRKNIIVALPISPKRCLIYGYPKKDLKIIQDEDLVEIINEHSYRYANEFIISNEAMPEISESFNKTIKPHNFSDN